MIKALLIVITALLAWLVFIQVPQILTRTRYSYAKEGTNTWKIDNQTGVGCAGIVNVNQGANVGDVLDTVNFGDCLTK